MAVVIAPDFMGVSGLDRKCTVCGRERYSAFVVWCCAQTNIIVCGRCAKSMRKGFTADLIQCAAIMDLQQLYGHSRVALQTVDVMKMIGNDPALEEIERRGGFAMKPENR